MKQSENIKPLSDKIIEDYKKMLVDGLGIDIEESGLSVLGLELSLYSLLVFDIKKEVDSYREEYNRIHVSIQFETLAINWIISNINSGYLEPGSWDEGLQFFYENPVTETGKEILEGLRSYLLNR